MTVESGHSIQKSTKGLRPRTFLQLFPGTFGLVTCSSHVHQLFFLCFISGCNVQILLCFLNRFKPFHLNLEEGKQLIFFFSSIQFEVCMIYRCLTRPHGTIVQRHALHLSVPYVAVHLYSQHEPCRRTHRSARQRCAHAEYVYCYNGDGKNILP